MLRAALRRERREGAGVAWEIEEESKKVFLREKERKRERLARQLSLQYWRMRAACSVIYWSWLKFSVVPGATVRLTCIAPALATILIAEICWSLLQTMLGISLLVNGFRWKAAVLTVFAVLVVFTVAFALVSVHRRLCCGQHFCITAWSPGEYHFSSQSSLANMGDGCWSICEVVHMLYRSSIMARNKGFEVLDLTTTFLVECTLSSEDRKAISSFTASHKDSESAFGRNI
jgi:hypothetical protein